MDYATFVDKLLSATIEMKASDLYLTVGNHPSVAVDGKILALKTKCLDKEDLTGIISAICPDHHQITLQSEGIVDFAVYYGRSGRNFRANAALDVKGPTLTLRLVSNSLPDPRKMGFPEQVIDMFTRPQGLILVTGPTGSGKSTTLAAFMNMLSMEYGRAISTVEQPIEFLIKQNTSDPVSIVRQFEVPQHIHSFSAALRGILRQAPNVIMVGELRDLETMETAIHAAETGHLVLTTVHTNSAAEAIFRITDAFPVDRQEHVKICLGAALLGVISQRLLPTKDGNGRVLAFETLLQHSGLPNQIRKGNVGPINGLIQTSRKLGMRLFDDHLVELVRANRISEETAIEFCRDKTMIHQRLKGL
jgi:twitching motility protein PilT